MKFRDGLLLAGAQLTRRRLRTFLCALSVGVGAAAMLLIAALSGGARQEIARRLEGLGLSGLSVYVSEDAPGRKLTQQHAALLENSVPEVSHAMALKAKTGSYRVGAVRGNAVFFGVTDTLGEVMQLQLLAGSLPTPQQVKNSEPVAVLDKNTAKTLYGRSNIVGKRIRFTINDAEQYYRVCGVIEPQSSSLGILLGSAVPTIIYLPYSRLAAPTDSADQIMVQCAAGADSAAAGEKIEHVLSRQAQVAGKLAVQDMSGARAQVEGAVRLAAALFLAVAAISFLVAMLGVLSGMLSAAHEKTAEIGLFMALGARKRDIARLFLTQAVLISIVGGAGGLAAVMLLLGIVRAAGGAVLTVPLPLTAAVLGLCALCGALAGVLPALHAAGLRPVEAMRK